MHLLYPNSPIHRRQPDEQYAAEVEAVRAAGYEISLFSLDEFQSGEFLAVPPIPAYAKILYRGWMMSAVEYEGLGLAMTGCGASPVVSTQEYLASHYLPNWYPQIRDLTPETRVYTVGCDLEAELRTLDWPEYFIKDYVKSLKTSTGSRISKPEQAARVVADMHRVRGTIEGGFCVRRVEDFLPDTERRYFVLDAMPQAASGEIPQIVHECASRLRAPFYSVDVVQRADGQLRIVEIGDGQVSDLVGWTPGQFAAILKRLCQH